MNEKAENAEERKAAKKDKIMKIKEKLKFQELQSNMHTFSPLSNRGEIAKIKLFDSFDKIPERVKNNIICSPK